MLLMGVVGSMIMSGSNSQEFLGTAEISVSSSGQLGGVRWVGAIGHVLRNCHHTAGAGGRRVALGHGYRTARYNVKVVVANESRPMVTRHASVFLCCPPPPA